MSRRALLTFLTLAAASLPLGADHPRAFADPVELTDDAAASPPAHDAVTIGAGLGWISLPGDDLAGPERYLDLGYRIGADLSLHLRVGEADVTGEDRRAHLTDVAAGVEARRCTRSRRVCGFVGVDVGVRDGHLSDRLARLEQDVSGATVRLHGGAEVRLASRVALRLETGALGFLSTGDTDSALSLGAGLGLVVGF